MQSLSDARAMLKVLEESGTIDSPTGSASSQRHYVVSGLSHQASPPPEHALLGSLYEHKMEWPNIRMRAQSKFSFWHRRLGLELDSTQASLTSSGALCVSSVRPF